MKKMLAAGLVALLGLGAYTTQAQNTTKVGYTNVDAILSGLPEAKKIETELKAYQDQLAGEFQKKQKEAQTKLAAYQKEQGNLLPSIRETREKELQTLQQGLQEFQERAGQDIQGKQAQLLSPVYEKIQKTIDEVAKAENYDMILSSSASAAPVLLFAKESDDITNKVIVKLGGTPFNKNEGTAQPANNSGTKPAPKTGN